jgi:hypothetical protein
MRPSGPGRIEWRPILSVVLGAGLLPFLLGASAAPASASCPWNETPRAVFDVADRADLAWHIPGLATTPEVVGDPILKNGKPAGLEGPLHVTVYDCLPGAKSLRICHWEEPCQLWFAISSWSRNSTETPGGSLRLTSPG